MRNSSRASLWRPLRWWRGPVQRRSVPQVRERLRWAPRGSVLRRGGLLHRGLPPTVQMGQQSLAPRLMLLPGQPLLCASLRRELALCLALLPISVDSYMLEMSRSTGNCMRIALRYVVSHFEPMIGAWDSSPGTLRMSETRATGNGPGKAGAMINWNDPRRSTGAALRRACIIVCALHLVYSAASNFKKLLYSLLP